MRSRVPSACALLALAACSSVEPAEPGTNPQQSNPVDPGTSVMPVAGAGAMQQAPTTPGPIMAAPTDPMATPSTPTPSTPTPTVPDPTMPDPASMPGTGLAMDECGLDTPYDGDEYCINPPPPDKGFQIRVGPDDYDNPGPRYVLEPGAEVDEVFTATTGNTTDVFYYWRQYRMRPGSHHAIFMAGARRLGGTQNYAKDNPDRGIIAPENAGIGMPLGPNTNVSISLHYINYTDQPIIKEVWVNFWYRDPSEVTEPTLEMFTMAPMGIGPGQHVVVNGTCPISEAGRVLTLYGHVHSHNKRFSAWRVRGGERTLLHESYDWVHPAVLEYSSIVSNMPPDPASKTAGGFDGMVDLRAGDTLEFECDIVNDTTETFVGRNEALNDEMCILVGDTVGVSVPRACNYRTIPQ